MIMCPSDIMCQRNPLTPIPTSSSPVGEDEVDGEVVLAVGGVLAQNCSDCWIWEYTESVEMYGVRD